MSSSLRDALIRAAALPEPTPHYEPIIVSPAEYADPEFMAALKENFPNGRLVWRPYCDGCVLCKRAG